MNVLGVTVCHPLRKMTGATVAGYELSKHISMNIPYTLAVMWDKDETFKDGNLTVKRFRSTNILNPFKRFLPRFAYVPLFSSKIPEFISHNNFELVHIHNNIPTLAMKKIAKECIRNHIPYCLSVHGIMELPKYAEIMKFNMVKRILAEMGITRPFFYVLKNAAWVFVLSPADYVILDQVGYPKERTSYVTNGVRIALLAPGLPSELMKMKERLGIVEDKNPKLLFVGSLFPYKGVDIFLKCLHWISNPATAIIGGKLKSEEEKQNLLRDARCESLKRHRIIFTGWLEENELRPLYQLADIFVYPTRGDTLPLCILEAMASGLPIVSTNIGGIPYQLDGGAGFVVEPGNPESVAKKVSMLLENKELRRQMGSSARKRVEEAFSWENSAKAAVVGYERIISIHRNNGTAPVKPHSSTSQ